VGRGIIALGTVLPVMPSGRRTPKGLFRRRQQLITRLYNQGTATVATDGTKTGMLKRIICLLLFHPLDKVVSS
jgi:hypothetical protein